MIESQGSAARLAELPDESSLSGEVQLDVLYSSYNYKDGLALSGGPIVRTWPLV
ncbi:MAG: oxidoreductase, partial [Microbacteriaceae bacterium]|nr:oxidoreductase [Microbacteriaceae bacterium]